MARARPTPWVLLPLALLLLCPGPAGAAGPADDDPTRWLRRLVHGWFRRQQLPPVLPDVRLFTVARLNSEALAELAPAGSGGGTLAHGVSAYLHFLLQQHEVMDAVVQAVAVRSSSREQVRQRLGDFLEQRARLGELTHYGVGLKASAAGDVVTLVMVRRRIKVEAVMTTGEGGPLRICAKRISGESPRVFVTTPQGNVLLREPVLPDPQFCVRFPAVARGRYQVEMMIDGPLGPEVAALFPFYVGVPRPRLPVQKIYPHQEIRQQEVETKLLLWINQRRAQAGLDPLEPHRVLARVARNHSRNMIQNGFFGHSSPAQGTLKRRLQAAGLAYEEASENLAMSTSAARAHDSLMASPGHRRNILDPKMTHVGVGADFDSRQSLLYVTECFARLRPGE